MDLSEGIKVIRRVGERNERDFLAVIRRGYGKRLVGYGVWLPCRPPSLPQTQQIFVRRAGAEIWEVPHLPPQGGVTNIP